MAVDDISWFVVLCWAFLLVSARVHSAKRLTAFASHVVVSAIALGLAMRSHLETAQPIPPGLSAAFAAAVVPVIANLSLVGDDGPCGIGVITTLLCQCNACGSAALTAPARSPGSRDIDAFEAGGLGADDESDAPMSGRSAGSSSIDSHGGDAGAPIGQRGRVFADGGIVSTASLREITAQGIASMINAMLRSAVLWRAFDHPIASAIQVTRVSLSRTSAAEAATAIMAGTPDHAASRRVIASCAEADDAALKGDAELAAELTSAAAGRGARERFVELEAEMVVGGEHCNSFGAMHGGCALTLIDVTTTLAMLALDCTRPGVTTDLSASVARPVKRGERIRIVARILSFGRRFAFTEADIIGQDGKTAAFGRHTKAV
jgi:uncharacterized protein (TIGR00369 family)